MTVSNPPFERILHILNWFVQILFNLTWLRSNVISNWNIWECSKVIIVGLQECNKSLDNYTGESKTYRISGARSRDSYIVHALILGNVLFMNKIFCFVHPFSFPALLLEVLSLETWVKDWKVKLALDVRERTDCYPLWFNMLMKGQSLNSNDWFSCAQASLQPGLQDGMASLW